MHTLINKGVFIGDTDQAKVSLFVNLTMNEKLKKQNDKELDQMKYLSVKYGEKELAVFGQFAYDI